jgi:hypothetical protein
LEKNRYTIYNEYYTILSKQTAMRKKKIIIWLLCILALILFLFFVFRKSFISQIAFGDFHPREPKNEIEETYNIGWWSNQETMKVDTFTVEIIESKLNLFNSFSLIKYTVQGELEDKGKWKPYISKVHISQRFVRKYDQKRHSYLDRDTISTPEAIIEITPIIEEKENKRYKGEKIPFKFTNELKIMSFHWGDNKVRIQCCNFHKDIILQQRK